MPHKAEPEITVTVRPVIVRACARCGARRELEKPCGECGLTDAPETVDLGIQAASYDNALKQLQWRLFGEPAAKRRALKANQELKDGN